MICFFLMQATDYVHIIQAVKTLVLSSYAGTEVPRSSKKFQDVLASHFVFRTVPSQDWTASENVVFLVFKRPDC